MRLDDLIAEALEADIYTHAGIAEKLCDTEPDAVAEYLTAHRVVLVAEIVAARGRSRRSWRASNRAKSVFAEAVEAGEVASWRGFAAAAFAVDEDNTQKRVARMSRKDCLFVADRFTARERENGLMAAVFRAIAKRVPDGKEVAEVFTEDALDELRERVLAA